MKSILIFFTIFFSFTSSLYSMSLFDKNSYVDNIYYEKDISNKNIDEIIKKKEWENKDNRPKVGYSNYPIWYKFSINKTNNDEYMIFNEFVIEYIDVYVVKNNKVLKKHQAGIKQPVDKSLFSYRKTLIPLLDFQDGIYDIYIKVSGQSHALAIFPQILDKETLFTLKAYDSSIVNIYLFILMLMLILNIIIYYMTRLSYYKEYIIYLSLLLIVSLFANYYVHIFVFTEGISDFFISIFKFLTLLMIYTMLNLISRFIVFSDFNKKVLLYIFIGVFLTFGINTIHLLLYNQSLLIWLFINFILIIVSCLYIIFFIFKNTIKFNHKSFIVALIWLPLFICILLFILNIIFFFISPIVMGYIMNILFIYESIFISLLLAYNMRVIKEKKYLIELELEKKENIILRNKKLASMGEMLNNIAHQWKQPLARINSIVFKCNMLLEKNNTKDISNELTLIENQTEDMSKTISSLLSFFHLNKEIDTINLYNLAVNQIKLIKEIDKNIKVKIICKDKTSSILGYKAEYEQVVRVVVENAIDSFKDLDITNAKIIFTIIKDDKIAFIIENNGLNIDKTILEKIFEPYFTTKNKKLHQGIGLYMSKMLIEESMQKKLDVTNTQHGVKFIITG